MLWKRGWHSRFHYFSLFCLENILLIKINGPLLRKIHEDVDNVLVSQTIDLYVERKN